MTDQQQTPVQPPMQQAPAVQMPSQQAPTQQAPAAQAPAAPTPASVYQQIIDEQQAQIAAMQAQNAALNAQVVSFINNGAQLPQQQAPTQQQAPAQQAPYVGQNWAVQPTQFAPVYEGNGFSPVSLAQDVDVSLEGLAGEIGKKPQNS